MATAAIDIERRAWRRQAWVTTVMALTLALGFTVQLAAGRSSFAAPPVVHVHAIIFFGWAVIATAQAWFAATGRMEMHRPLGWLGAAWALMMVAAGVAVMLNAVGEVRSPFFFMPQVFLIENLAGLLCFAAMTAAAIVLRRDGGWHRRLHLGALACLMGPGFGRLLPMPLLTPFAMEIAMLPGLAFPAWLAWREWREDGRLHPAWVPGIALLPAVTLLAWSLAHSPAGDAIYAAAVAGRPGESVPGLAFPPPPGG
ncbi:MAG: hypothetical protein ACK4Z0_01630 [Sphingomonadaceae bacterium]